MKKGIVTLLFLMITAAANAADMSHSLYLKTGVVPFCGIYYHDNNEFDKIESSGSVLYTEYLFRYGNGGIGVYLEYQLLFSRIKDNNSYPIHENLFRTTGLNGRWYFMNMFYSGAGIGYRILERTTKWDGNIWIQHPIIEARLFTGMDYRITDYIYLNTEFAISGPVSFNQFDTYKTNAGNKIRLNDSIGGVDITFYFGICARLQQN